MPNAKQQFLKKCIHLSAKNFSLLLIRCFLITGLLTTALLIETTTGDSSKAFAGEADVLDVKIDALGGQKFRINVSVKHADAGWEHYANKWEVFTLDGRLIGTRELAHPHNNEQPFTRSLSLEIPLEIKEIILRAADSVHKTGGKEMQIGVPHPS